MIAAFSELLLFFLELVARYLRVFYEKIRCNFEQFSLLSPFLFNLFFNDMPCPKNCELGKYFQKALENGITISKFATPKQS
jgi:hypothetical protein